MYLHEEKVYTNFSALTEALGIDDATFEQLPDIIETYNVTRPEVVIPDIDHEYYQHDPEKGVLSDDKKQYTVGVTPHVFFAHLENNVVRFVMREATNQAVMVPDNLAKWISPGWGFDDSTKTLFPSSLTDVKKKAIERIAKKANFYQQKIIGTEDSDRTKRFEMNMTAAKALLSGNATESQSDMLQLQLDANTFAGHSLIENMTLEEFAGWIVSYDDITIQAIGLIENILIVGRAQVNQATSVPDIDAVLNQLTEQAEQQFLLLMSGGGE